jgi:uncharacterized protein (DUF1015 family)
MADIKPLRAWRYSGKAGPIEELISPLFDTVETSELTRLYKNPLNSIHISVPEKKSKPHSDIVSEWKLKKIIEQDYLPGIYVYYQYFTLPISEKILCQKGFICNIRLHEWEEKQILKHEAIIPSSLHDRIEVLENSEMNICPTHGLYSDPEHSLEKYMDESMTAPVYDIKDSNGVINKVAIIHDKKVIEKFIAVLKNKPVILADGHHRFNASMIYKKQKTEKQVFIGTEPWNFHCMYLSNTEANEVKILATHRIIDPIENFDQEKFLKKISEYFELKKINDVNLINSEIAGHKWNYGLILKNEQYILILKKDLTSKIEWNFPKEIKELDLTVLHYFIIGKGLNIKEKDQKNIKNINFSNKFTKCINAVKEDKAQMALITREIPIEEVKKVCYSGYTFPQKSTYFYPKVICGLVFSSVKQEDFITEIDSCIKLKQV